MASGLVVVWHSAASYGMPTAAHKLEGEARVQTQAMAAAVPMAAPKAPPVYNYGPRNCCCPGAGAAGGCGYYRTCCARYMSEPKRMSGTMTTYRESPEKAWCIGCCGYNPRKRNAAEAGIDVRWPEPPPAGHVEPVPKAKNAPPAGKFPGWMALPKPKAKPKAKAKAGAKGKPKAKPGAPPAGPAKAAPPVVAAMQQEAAAGFADLLAAVREQMVGLVRDVGKAVLEVRAGLAAPGPGGGPAGPAGPAAGAAAAAAPVPAPAAPVPAPAAPAAPPLLAAGEMPPGWAAGTVLELNLSPSLRTLIGVALRSQGSTPEVIFARLAAEGLHKTQAANFAAVNLGLALVRPGVFIEGFDMKPRSGASTDSDFQKWLAGESLADIRAGKVGREAVVPRRPFFKSRGTGIEKKEASDSALR